MDRQQAPSGDSAVTAAHLRAPAIGPVPKLTMRGGCTGLRGYTAAESALILARFREANVKRDPGVRFCCRACGHWHVSSRGVAPGRKGALAAKLRFIKREGPTT